MDKGRQNRDAFMAEMKRLAFSRVMTALRLKGPFKEEVRRGLSELKDEFDISEECYVQELRRVSHDECIQKLAENVRGARLSWLHEGHVMAQRLLKRRKKGRLCSKKYYDSRSSRKASAVVNSPSSGSAPAAATPSSSSSRDEDSVHSSPGKGSKKKRSDRGPKRRRGKLAATISELQGSLKSMAVRSQISRASSVAPFLVMETPEELEMEKERDRIIRDAITGRMAAAEAARIEQLTRELRQANGRRKNWSVDAIADRLRAKSFVKHVVASHAAAAAAAAQVQASASSQSSEPPPVEETPAPCDAIDDDFFGAGGMDDLGLDESEAPEDVENIQKGEAQEAGGDTETVEETIVEDPLAFGRKAPALFLPSGSVPATEDDNEDDEPYAPYVRMAAPSLFHQHPPGNLPVYVGSSFFPPLPVSPPRPPPSPVNLNMMNINMNTSTSFNSTRPQLMSLTNYLRLSSVPGGAGAGTAQILTDGRGYPLSVAATFANVSNVEEMLASIEGRRN